MLSVVFSTHNGAETLPRMLESLERVILPEGGWHIVAVDNGSTDDTPTILADHGSRLPLTTLSFSRKGKNRALNHALSYVQGDLVVFTDDDVIVDPNWLSHMRRAADRHPDVTMFGGRVAADWPAGVPNLARAAGLPLKTLYALTPEEWGTGPIVASNLHGANLAIRAHVFSKGVRYDESVGPDGTSSYAMGSETSLTKYLSEKGHSSWFVSEAVVHHIIRPGQMTREWIVARGFRSGRGDYRIINPEPLDVPWLFGYPRYLVRAIVAETARSRLFTVLGRKRLALQHAWNASYLRGLAVEARRLNGEPSR